MLDGRKKKGFFFPNYKNMLGENVDFISDTSTNMWAGRPKAAEHLLPSSRLPVVIAPLQSDHPLQSTEYSKRTETQPLLHQTQLSHLTGSCYSEVATGLSALCSSEGGCYLSLKTQELVKITGSIPCLSPFCQSTQIGVRGIAADRC